MFIFRIRVTRKRAIFGLQVGVYSCSKLAKDFDVIKT